MRGEGRPSTREASHLPKSRLPFQAPANQSYYNSFQSWVNSPFSSCFLCVYISPTLWDYLAFWPDYVIWRWLISEDEMVGWHHWLDGHEFEQTPGVSDGQGGLACCSPWGRNKLDPTEWLNWTELNFKCMTNKRLLLQGWVYQTENSTIHFYSPLSEEIQKCQHSQEKN